MNSSQNSQWLGWLVGLALLVSACAAPAPVAEEPAPETPASIATEAPVSATSQPAGLPFAFEGVSLALDPAVASGGSGEIIPENPGTTDGPYWEAQPETIQISMAGYPLSNTFFQPMVSVYPVEDFRRLNSQSAPVIDSLHNLLAEKPAAMDQLPFLPLVNAGQVFSSNVKYLDFQGGKGVRFLTLYAQYPAPINNHELFYTYQGLTGDGRYYVSMILPVNNSALPASADQLAMDELESIARDAQYYTQTSDLLTALPDESFTPNLAALDALAASLVIER